MKNKNKMARSETTEEEIFISEKPHRAECTGKPAGYIPLVLTKLLEQEHNYTKKSNTVPPTTLIPHRPESLGRPIGLPTLRLSDLLDQETENTNSNEIDTGPPVGNEVC